MTAPTQRRERTREVTVRVDEDGLFHLQKDGCLSPRGWAPSGAYERRLLDMVVALLNGRDDSFTFTAEELGLARTAGMDADTLRHELRREAFSIYVRFLL